MNVSRRTLLLAGTAAATAAWTHGGVPSGGGGPTAQALSDSASSSDALGVGRTGSANLALSDTVVTSDSTAGPGVSNIRNAPAWQANTAYALNYRVTNGPNAYQCSAAGTSAASGGPTGTGTNIVDGAGTLRWNFSSSFDFSSLTSWAAANAGTVTVPGGLTARVWNDNQTAYGAQTVTGVITPDASHGVFVTAAPGESFADKGPSSRLGQPSAADGVLFDQPNTALTNANTLTFGQQPSSPTMDNLTVTRIQTTNQSNAGGVGTGIQAWMGQGAILTVKQCKVSCNDFHESCPIGPNASGPTPGNIVAANNLIVWPSIPTSGGNTRAVFGTHYNGRLEYNTFVVPLERATGHASRCDFVVGASYIGPQLTVLNNMVAGYGCVYGYCGTPNPSLVQAQADGHNGTDLSTFQIEACNPTPPGCTSLAPGGLAGTQCVTGIVTSVPFSTATFVQPDDTSGGLDMRLAAGSVLLHAANTTLANETADIFGTLRPAGRGDIGAFQLST